MRVSSAEEGVGATVEVSPVSLRRDLLLTFGILTAAALVVAVLSVLLSVGFAGVPYGPAYLCVLIAADVAVFVGFGAHQLRRLVSNPLERTLEAVEAIANGDLGRRVPPGETHEFAALASSVNRMTDRLLEEQLQRARAERLASVGRLAAGVAHEIGNPLGAINGYAHLLRRAADSGLAADTVEALDGLDRESARIDEIVRGLLDYARPRYVTPTPIDVNDAVRSVTGFLAHQGALRRVTVRTTLDPAAPRLYGERHQIEQLLVNLLLNAADATGEGGEISVATRRVSVAELRAEGPRRSGDTRSHAPHRLNAHARAWLDRAGPLADVVRIVVADSGTGIPPEDFERIFEPFYTTKEPGKGTGLGLAIVARIVEGLRGTVWAQRAREGGAAFVLLFPLLTGVATPPRGSRRSTPRTSYHVGSAT